MKKMIFILMCCVAVSSVVYADDDKPISMSQLPENSQQFIGKYFTDSKVSYVTVERDWFGKDYKVVFADGRRVEFSKNGEWKDVDCNHTQVPAGIVPQAIIDYIAINHEGAAVVEIDRDSRDYEVKLANRLELKFDLMFNLIGIDD